MNFLKLIEFGRVTLARLVMTEDVDACNYFEIVSIDFLYLKNSVVIEIKCSLDPHEPSD